MNGTRQGRETKRTPESDDGLAALAEVVGAVEDAPGVDEVGPVALDEGEDALRRDAGDVVPDGK